MGQKTTLILVRHGQSEWNRLNLFTGWVDIPLSPHGIVESLEVGKQIAQLPIDMIFTSTLVRATMTAMLAMAGHSSGKVPCIQHHTGGKLETWGRVYDEAAENRCIPVIQAWELNERMYGELQGLNKHEMIARFGEEQVQRWRRSYSIAPPGGESLEMAAKRTLPYFKESILSCIKGGQHVLVSAHGNSLRAIVMYLDSLTPDQVVHLEIPTGKPMIYDFFDEQWEKR